MNRYINYDVLMDWIVKARSNKSPCEDERDVGYLDCLDDLKEIVEELLETSTKVKELNKITRGARWTNTKKN